MLGWVLCGVLGTAALAQGAVGGIYTCVDSKGRKLTSDRPIAECMDREQKLLNPSGTVRAKVAPVLTASERAELEAKQKEEAEALALQAEQKRRERALLVRYPSRPVHDKERAQALAQVATIKQSTNARIDDLQKDLRQMEQELEFYKKNPSKAPLSLRRQVDDIVQSIAVQKRFLAEQDNEVRRINGRFDEELQRLNVLWAAQSRAAPGVANGKKTP
jgi:hypothetical protein